MVKCAIAGGGVFLGASGMGVSEPVAVEALGVAVSLRRFFDFGQLRQEEAAREEDGNVVGGNGDNHRSGLLSQTVTKQGRLSHD